MCFVTVVFVFVLFFFLVQDRFILAHVIGALLYLCIHWSVQHIYKKKKSTRVLDTSFDNQGPAVICGPVSNIVYRELSQNTTGSVIETGTKRSTDLLKVTINRAEGCWHSEFIVLIFRKP